MSPKSVPLAISYFPMEIPNMSEQQNIQVVQDAYAAFGQDDIQGVLAKVADNVEWFLPGEGLIPQSGLYRGRDGVAEFFKKLADTTEFESFEPAEFIAQGDRVIVCGSYSAKSKATGRGFQADWCMSFTFADGKIARFREYSDTATIADAYRGAMTA
jgi:ketosteroid isomerase-like protein